MYKCSMGKPYILGCLLATLLSLGWPATAEVLPPASYAYDIAPTAPYTDSGNELFDGHLPRTWSSSTTEPWVGFRQSDASITLSYSSTVTVDQVRLYHDRDHPFGGQIFLPLEVSFSFSDDGVTFGNVQTFPVAVDAVPNLSPDFLNFTLGGDGEFRSGRFVRIYEKWRQVLGDVPNHNDAWLFLGETEVHGAFAVLTVRIDIKPGSFPNSINLGSSGFVPVAILSSAAFDAGQVDPETVTLAGASVRLIGRGSKYACAPEDVNSDGLLDLVCHVETAQFMVEPGSSSVELAGRTFGGHNIRGEDSINVVK